MFALISVLFEDKIGPTPSGCVTLLIADRENNINDTAPMLSLFEDRILKPTTAGGAGRGEARRGGNLVTVLPGGPEDWSYLPSTSAKALSQSTRSHVPSCFTVVTPQR